MNQYLKSRLQQIVDDTNPKAFNRAVKRDTELFTEVSSQRGGSFSEKAYNFLTDYETYECPYGNARKYKSIVEGHQFCSKKKCICREYSRSTTVSYKMSIKPKSEKQAANRKREQTNLTNSNGEYSNNGQSPKARAAHAEYANDPERIQAGIKVNQENCLKNHGVTSHTQRQEVKDQIAATNTVRYGGPSPTSCPEIAKKSAQTRHENRDPNAIKNNFPKFEKLLEDRFNVRILMKKDDYQGMTDTRVHTFECLDCGYHFDKRFHYGNGKGPICKVCHPTILTYRSGEENEVKNFVETVTESRIRQSDRSIINPHEIDIHAIDARVAVEYGGIHWHSEGTDPKKVKDYHRNKFDQMRNKSIHLITVFSDDWKYSRNSVENHIQRYLDDFEVDAENCSVQPITSEEAHEFHITFNPSGTCKDFDDSFEIIYDGGRIGVFSICGNSVERLSLIKNIKDVYSAISKYGKDDLNMDYIEFTLDLRWDKIPEDIHATLHSPRPYCAIGSDVRVLPEEVGLCEDSDLSEYVTKGYDRIWDCGSATIVFK